MKYQIENKRVQTEHIRDWDCSCEFLFEYGYHEGKPVGRIIAEPKIEAGIGKIGVHFQEDFVLLGPEWERLFVKEGYREGGIGKKLTELAIKYCREIAGQEMIQLLTLEAVVKPTDNTAGIEILVGLGFQLDDKKSTEQNKYYRSLLE